MPQTAPETLLGWAASIRLPELNCLAVLDDHHDVKGGSQKHSCGSAGAGTLEPITEAAPLVFKQPPDPVLRHAMVGGKAEGVQQRHRRLCQMREVGRKNFDFLAGEQLHPKSL